MSSFRGSNPLLYDSTHRDSIRAFYDVLKSNENDEEFIKNAIMKPESSDLIKLILTKQRKNDFDIYILKEYLKQLSKLMTLINKSHDPNYLLTKISMDLTIENKKEKSFLMKIDSEVNIFYILLSGEILILTPKIYTISMNRYQYVEHLKNLYSLNETYLLEQTIRENINIFFVDNFEYEIKELNIINAFIFHQIQIDEYLDLVNAVNINKNTGSLNVSKSLMNIENNNNKSNLKKLNISILGYSKLMSLNKGSTFTQGNLINENIKKQMAIFLKTNCIFGILKDYSYHSFFQNFQKKIQNENYAFILNNPLFKNVNIKEFIKTYWNYFEEKTIKRDEYLFKYNTERTKLYFLKEGEIKLIANKLSFEKINKYISEFKNKIYIKGTNEENGRSIDVVLKYIKKGESFGMGDMIYNNKLFCSGICISENATFISIDMKYIENIMEKYEIVIDNWKIVEEEKISMMIDRLNALKRAFQNSIEEQIIKDDKLNKKIKQKTIENYFSQKKKLHNNSHKVIKLISHKFDLNPNNNNRSTNNLINNKTKLSIPKKKNSMRKYPLLSINSYRDLAIRKNLNPLLPNISISKNNINNHKMKNNLIFSQSNNTLFSKSISNENNKQSFNNIYNSLSPDNKNIKKIIFKKKKNEKSILLKKNIYGNNIINTSFNTPHYEQDAISKILLSMSCEKEEKGKTRNLFHSNTDKTIKNKNKKNGLLNLQMNNNNSTSKINSTKFNSLNKKIMLKTIFGNYIINNFRNKNNNN